MLYLYDTTLRDGAQGQSVTFSLQDKEQVIQRLDEVGMHFIEAGNPASNPKDAELYERMRTQPLKNAKLVAFGSTRRVGAEAHADAGLNVLANVGCQHVAIFGKILGFSCAGGAAHHLAGKPQHDCRFGAVPLSGGQGRVL